MTRFAPFALIAAAALAAASGPAVAQSRGGYTATPATAPASNMFVTRSVVWHCNNGVCVAPRSGSRDQIMCELAVKQVGTLSAFTVNGAAMEPASLEKCNAKAK